MDAGGIQRLLASADPHEARALLKGLRPELRHLQDLLPAGKTAVLLTIGDDILRGGLRDAGDILQKRGRCRVQVDAHRVHAVLDHPGKGFTELLLVHVVLILSDADGFRVDLHELRQRILDPAGYTGRGALSHIELREFLRRQGTGGIDRCARLIGNNVGDLVRKFLQDSRQELLRFTGSRAVAHRDQIHAVSGHQLADLLRGLRLLPLVRRHGGIDHRRVQDLSGGVHHRQLAAGAEGRIPAQHHCALDGRLHEELVQVLSEHQDGAVLGLLRKAVPEFALNRRRDQPCVAVLDGPLHRVPGRRVVSADQPALQKAQDLVLRRLDGHFQDLLLLAAVDRQDTVSGGLRHRFREVIVSLVDRLLFLILGFGGKDAPTLRHGAHIAADRGRVGETLRQNVTGPLDGFFHSRDALFLGKIGLCLLFQGLFRLLGPQNVRQTAQPLLHGDGRAGGPLRPERTVQVVEGDAGLRSFDGSPQLLGQLSLGLDGLQDLLFLFLQVSQRGQSHSQSTQLFVVQRARGLFPVAGDERNGAAFVDQLHGGVHLPVLNAEFRRDFLNDIHSFPPSKGHFPRIYAGFSTFIHIIPRFYAAFWG